jgi:hypothetical protein
MSFVVTKAAVAVANVNYTANASDTHVVVSGLTTTPRTITLPLLSTMKEGQKLEVVDGDGSCNGTGTLTLARQGTDLIGAATSLVKTTPLFKLVLIAYPSLGRYRVETALLT